MDRVSAWTDIQEEAFLKCLKEIEKTYVHLPKILRIRTEKWVEKLVSTCANVMWRKHRNAYARLLLNMVAMKSFSDPFHCLPPDGPLPSFPAHVKAFGKDLLGPHETRFWRNLYDQANEVSKENAPYSESSSAMTHHSEAAVSKEVRNLNLLVRDQAQRIQILEQQVRDERSKYELEIQRLHLEHRLELSRLRDNVPATPPRSRTPDAPTNISHQPLPVPLPSFISSAEGFLAPQASRSPLTGRAYDTRIRSSDERSFLADSLTRSQPFPPAPPLQLAHPSQLSQHSNSLSSSRPPVSLFPSMQSQLPTSFLAATTSLDRSMQEAYLSVDSQQHSDTIKRYPVAHREAPPSPVRDLLPQPRPAVSSVSSRSSPPGPSSDEDFLNFVDQFQSEIRRLHLDDEPVDSI